MNVKQPSIPGIPASMGPRKKPEAKEARVQSDLFRFLRMFEKQEPRFRFIHGSMNGLPLFGKVLASACRTGLTKGIWDVGIPYPGVWSGQSFSFMYIELKDKYRSLTPEQKEFMEACQDRYAFVVAKDWLTAARAICTYLGVQDTRILEAIK